LDAQIEWVSGGNGQEFGETEARGAAEAFARVEWKRVLTKVKNSVSAVDLGGGRENPINWRIREGD